MPSSTAYGELLVAQLPGVLHVLEQGHTLVSHDFVHFGSIVLEEAKVGDAAHAELLCKVRLVVSVDMDEHVVLRIGLELWSREHLTDVLLAEPSPHGAEVHEHHAVRSLRNFEPLLQAFVPLARLRWRELHLFRSCGRIEGERSLGERSIHLEILS